MNLTTVNFHGAELVALRGDTPETTLVAMKPVVEGMGLDWKGQFDKIKAHPVLSKGMGVIPIPSRGGTQDMTALPLNRLNFWLATIQPSRVPGDDVRAKVIAYQEECADVLFAHFFGREPWAGPIHAEILAAYRAAECFLRLTPAMAMPDLSNTRAVAPVAARARTLSRLTLPSPFAALRKISLMVLPAFVARLACR